ncbi:MAG: hypothetical protein KBB52_02625 [Candidatus Omnitrophica bacterium]|nr:hypothetical protein [Candidatus Omnitrophota bacterium]
MPYTSTRRLYNVVGKKISKVLSYRKAKRMCNEINRDILFFESRFLRSRLNRS